MNCAVQIDLVGNKGAAGLPSDGCSMLQAAIAGSEACARLCAIVPSACSRGLTARSVWPSLSRANRPNRPMRKVQKSASSSHCSGTPEAVSGPRGACRQALRTPRLGDPVQRHRDPSNGDGGGLAVLSKSSLAGGEARSVESSCKPGPEQPAWNSHLVMTAH